MDYCLEKNATELLKTFVKKEVLRGDERESSILEKVKKIDADSFFCLWKETYPSSEASKALFNIIYDKVINKNASNISVFKVAEPKDIYDFLTKACEHYKDLSDLLSKLVRVYSTKAQVSPNSATKEKSRRKGAEALKHMTEFGVKLMPVLDNGSYPCKKEQFEQYLTNDFTRIMSYLKDGYSIFRFSPNKSGLLCIDIDMGHENQINGVNKFYEFLEENKISKTRLPKYLQDIASGTFPAYCRTPSGGLHLYFKYDGVAISKQVLNQNVEVFHGNHINACGSYKAEKPYVLYGNLQDAPSFPPALLALLKEFKQEKLTKEADNIISKIRQDRIKTYTQDELFNYVKNDYSFSGKNELCFRYTLRAQKEFFTPREVVSFLRSHPETKSHKSVETTVKSAYRYHK